MYEELSPTQLIKLGKGAWLRAFGGIITIRCNSEVDCYWFEEIHLSSLRGKTSSIPEIKPSYSRYEFMKLVELLLGK